LSNTQSTKGTELLISSRPFSGELPAKITQALTLLACILVFGRCRVRMSAGKPTILAHFMLFLSFLRHVLG